MDSVDLISVACAFMDEKILDLAILSKGRLAVTASKPRIKIIKHLVNWKEGAAKVTRLMLMNGKDVDYMNCVRYIERLEGEDVLRFNLAKSEDIGFRLLASLTLSGSR